MPKPKLTAKRQAFCEEWTIDHNGTQAAIRAGYSVSTANEQASRLLANVNIKTEIRRLESARSSRVAVSADWVLNNLIDIAAKCSQGVPVMKMVNGTAVPTGEWKFDASGAIKANELIGKHLGMFVDRIDLRHIGNEALARKVIDMSTEMGVDPPQLRLDA